MLSSLLNVLLRIKQPYKVESSVNERLKILMNALNLSTAAFARALGVSDSTLRNYFDTARATKPGYEVLERLYHSFRTVNLPWLFGEPGEPLLAEATEGNSSVSNNKKISRSLVVGHVAGNATQNQGASASDPAAMQRENELLRSQLADKERTIQILLGNHPKP